MAVTRDAAGAVTFTTSLTDSPASGAQAITSQGQVVLPAPPRPSGTAASGAPTGATPAATQGQSAVVGILGSPGAPSTAPKVAPLPSTASAPAQPTGAGTRVVPAGGAITLPAADSPASITNGSDAPTTRQALVFTAYGADSPDPAPDAWHTYTLEKTSGVLRVWIDGTLVASYSAADPAWFTDAAEREGMRWTLSSVLDSTPAGAVSDTSGKGASLNLAYATVWTPDDVPTPPEPPTTAPHDPVITWANPDQVTGKADAGTRVTVTYDGMEPVNVVAHDDGTWTARPPAAVDPAALGSVTAQDTNAAGRRSGTVKANVHPASEVSPTPWRAPALVGDNATPKVAGGSAPATDAPAPSPVSASTAVPEGWQPCDPTSIVGCLLTLPTSSPSDTTNG